MIIVNQHEVGWLAAVGESKIKEKENSNLDMMIAIAKTAINPS
jgi:hypothetical protein